MIDKKNKILLCGLTLIVLAGQKLTPGEVEISEQERKIIDYLEKTKSEILQGRKFDDQTTAPNAFLTLISAYYHQDQNSIERTAPIFKQHKMPPELPTMFLDNLRKTIIRRIQLENKPPQESDLCGIYTSESPDGKINQVLILGYVEGAWRYFGNSYAIQNWIPQAKQTESMIRNILQSETVDQENSEVTPTSEEQSQEEQGQNNVSDKRHIAPKLILVLILIGMAGVIILFVVKSRGR